MFNKEIRTAIATKVANTMKFDKADRYMSYWEDFYVEEIDLHVEAHYGTSINCGDEYVPAVWAVTAWIGNCDRDEDGNLVIPDEAPCLTRECASPNKEGCWDMNSELVEQLVYDVLNIA